MSKNTDIGKQIVAKYKEYFYETFMKIYKWKEYTESKEDLDSELFFIHDLLFLFRKRKMGNFRFCAN